MAGVPEGLATKLVAGPALETKQASKGLKKGLEEGLERDLQEVQVAAGAGQAAVVCGTSAPSQGQKEGLALGRGPMSMLGQTVAAKAALRSLRSKEGLAAAASRGKRPSAMSLRG